MGLEYPFNLNMEKEDRGIGSYEYWGHTETHRDLAWAPQNASVTNLTIWDGDAEVKIGRAHV